MLPLFPLAPFGYDIISNISLAEKGDHYNTILQYGLRSVCEQADSSLDLVLQVSDSEGQMIHVSIIIVTLVLGSSQTFILLAGPRAQFPDQPPLPIPEESDSVEGSRQGPCAARGEYPDVISNVMYVHLVFVNVLLCRLIMGPSGRCWVFSTQEGIPTVMFMCLKER